MFSNIGKKIQGYSKMIFLIEVGIGLIGAIVAAGVLGSVLPDDAQVFVGLITICVFVIGIFLAWLGQMRLYAYGKIAESCEAMMRTMERMEAMQRAQIPARKCSGCGAVLENDAMFCTKCGTKNEG